MKDVIFFLTAIFFCLLFSFPVAPLIHILDVAGSFPALEFSAFSFFSPICVTYFLAASMLAAVVVLSGTLSGNRILVTGGALDGNPLSYTGKPSRGRSLLAVSL